MSRLRCLGRPSFNITACVLLLGIYYFTVIGCYILVCIIENNYMLLILLHGLFGRDVSHGIIPLTRYQLSLAIRGRSRVTVPIFL